MIRIYQKRGEIRGRPLQQHRRNGFATLISGRRHIARMNEQVRAIRERTQNPKYALDMSFRYQIYGYLAQPTYYYAYEPAAR